MVKPGPEMMVLAFALIKLGAPPVMVDPGMGWKNLAKCLEEAEPEGFIGIPLAHCARRTLGWARKTIRLSVTTGRVPVLADYTLAAVESLGEPTLDSARPKVDDMAAIAFTSGSTGPPKGVVYTHRMFCAQAAMLKESFGIMPGEIDLATFPLFALFDVAWEATTVFPKMDFTRPAKVDPREIAGVIERHSVTHMFGSPALLNRVGRWCEERGVRLPTLKRVLCAGSPVSERVIRRFAGLLKDNSLVHTPYGSTEALPVCSISHWDLAGVGTPEGMGGVCVGRPLKGVTLSIIRILDEAVENWNEELELGPGEVGEIVVWGDNVSESYFKRPAANSQAKIKMEGGRVAHRMGDLGYLDDAGRLWFCGRKSHRVQTSRGTLFSVACEVVFNGHPSVFRTALVGVGTPPFEKPVLCVEMEKGYRDSTTLREELLEIARGHPLTESIDTFLFHPSFPVDIRHNAKIFREQLAKWAERELS
jgi:acyl-CoA synthetase (AMP-forming)/AMP-acid ligase II